GAVERLRDRDARRRVADADGDRLGGREAVAVGHRRGDDVAAGGEARRGDRRARAERAGDARRPLDRRRAVAVLEVDRGAVEGDRPGGREAVRRRDDGEDRRRRVDGEGDRRRARLAAAVRGRGRDVVGADGGEPDGDGPAGAERALEVGRPGDRRREVAVDGVGRRGGEGGREVDREEPPVLRRGDGHGRRTVGDRQLHRGDAREAGRVPNRRRDRVRAAVEGGGGDAAARPEGAVDAR